MRSLLLVLPDSDARIERARGAGADVIVIDLAASPAAARAAWRRQAVDFIRETEGPPRLFVRLGPLTSPLTAGDLDAVIAARPRGLVLTGAADSAAVTRLSAMLRPREALAGLPDRAVAVIAMAADSPAGLLARADYRVAGPRLGGLGWDATALPRPLAATARTLTLAAAAAAGVAAIDTPFDVSGDLRDLETEARQARDDGFSGKFARDPGQVAAINRAFGPERRTGPPETVPILT